uniref:RING-type domain-containing protein n=1 Tax=Leersia perrieri TaxID=77586 RepID=A0A0D9XMK9_9ORYZ
MHARGSECVDDQFARSRFPQLSSPPPTQSNPSHTWRALRFASILPPFFPPLPMAVQAHYCNHHHQHHQQPPLFLARGVVSPETAMEFPQMTRQQQQQPPLFLDFSRGDGDGGNSRKRARETDSAAAAAMAMAHKRPPAPPAMGLRLDFDDGCSEHVSTTTSAASSLISDELVTQFDTYKNETANLLQDHTERLRRAVGESRRRHYRAMVAAAAAAAARRMREAEGEATAAARRGAELEERVVRLRAEAAAWQAKALADQSTAAALHAQLQQAQARGKSAAAEEDGNFAGAGDADDAESVFVDPDRVEEITPPPATARPCRNCRRRAASVVLLPCRHLCMCEACEPAVSAAGAACPACRGAVTGTVQVFLS